jgi:hypothetical protein
VKDCGGYLMGNPLTQKCQNCPAQNKVFSVAKGKCVDRSQIPVTDCLDTSRDPDAVYDSPLKVNKFNFNGTCYDKCPGAMVGEPTNGQCINCYMKNKTFSQDGVCVKTCKNYYVASKLNGTCTNCASIGKMWFNNTCVSGNKDSFPINYCFLDPTVNSMVLATPMNKLIQERICVDSCSPGYITMEGDIQCLNVTKSKLYIKGKYGVYECPDGWPPNDQRVCETCQSKGQYILDGKCVKDCPVNMGKHPSGLCMECKKDPSKNYTIFLNGTCVAKCPQYFSYDRPSGICMDCKSNGQVWYNGQCIDKCPTSFILNETLNYCYTCALTDKKFVNDGKCVYSCPISRFTNLLKYTCENKKAVKACGPPSPCENNGKCSIRRWDKKVVCKCGKKYLGKYCQYEKASVSEVMDKFGIKYINITLDNMLNNVTMGVPLPEDTIEAMEDLNVIVAQQPTLAKTEMSEKTMDIALDQLSLNQTNPALLGVSDLAMNLAINS